MGRWIDADKLKHEAELCRETTDAFIELINRQPEIEKLGWTKLVTREEQFDDESTPRKVYACYECGQSYKTKHDVINYCSNCGREIIGVRPWNTDPIVITVRR